MTKFAHEGPPHHLPVQVSTAQQGAYMPPLLSAYMPPIFYGSDLVYREDTIRTDHVLNSVAVHFKSAEQIVILATSVLARSLMS